LKLVKTLALQDSALQYYYLQPPSPIRSYDLPSLKEVVVSQAENSISALESFPSKPSDLKEAFVWPLRDLKVSQLWRWNFSDRDRQRRVSKISKREFGSRWSQDIFITSASHRR
jgi:hypothetical protein